MRLRTLALLATLPLAAACSGSGSSTSSTGGSGGSTGGSTCTVANALTCTCARDSDCPTTAGYSCDTDVTKLCIWQCNTAADCTGEGAPDSIKTQCDNAALGCTCDVNPLTQLSACNTKVCATDGDCGSGQVCTDGACVTPAVTSVDSCKVFPEFQVMHAGSSYTFKAQAYAAGKPVHVADTAFSWSAADASVTASGATFTGAAASTGAVAGVKASINGHDCTGQVQVYGAAAAGTFRAVVVDQLSGLPVSGAKVKLEGSDVVGTTDAAGVASFAAADLGTAASPFTVSVFEDSFGYVTLAGTASNDVLIPLLRNATDKEGGVSGTTANLFSGTSDVHVGIVGTSIAGGITEISFTLLLGPSVPTDINVGSKTFSDIPLPSGVLVGLGGNSFKEGFTALGRAGYCDDTSKASIGECGTRSLWGLGGDVPLDKLTSILNQVGSGSGGVANLNIGPILNSLLPVFSKFHSVVRRDESFSLKSVATNGDVDPSAVTALSSPLDFAQTGTGAGEGVKLSLKTTVKIPTLPKLAGSFVDGALVLGVVDVPGRGLVPLGLSAGLDKSSTTDTADGHVTDAAGTKDQVTLDLAPAHGGAEGNPYKLGILAASFTNLSNGLSASGIVVEPSPCTGGSTQGICYGGTIDSQQQFLSFPEGASYNYITRTFTGFPTGASFYKALFEDAAGHRWTVYLAPPAGGVFTMPQTLSGREDRTRADDQTGGRSDLILQAFDLGKDGSDHVIGLDTLAPFNDSNLDHLDSLLVRFAVTDYAPPTIVFTSPAAGATVAAGSTATVTIAGDAANANKWVLCFSATDTAITDVSACTAGNPPDATGKASAQVPANKTGAGYLHGVLVDAAGAPLNPAVDTALQVN